MKGIPFDLQQQQGKKGVFEVADFSSLVAAVVPCSSSSSASSKWKNLNQQQQQQQQGGGRTSSSSKKFVVGAGEPTSVLDTRRSPSPPTSSSTLSSSLGGSGGGGSTDTGGVAAVSDNPPHHSWPSTQEGTSSTATLVGVGVGVAAAADLSPAAAAGRPNSCSSKDGEWGGGGSELHPIPTSLDITNGVSGSERCGGGGLGLGVEDWESMLSESTAAVVASSPTQDQSLLRWIMGDVEDPSSGLKQLLQGVGPSDMEQGGPNVGFGLTDPSFAFDNPPIIITSTTSAAAAAAGSSSSSMAMAIPSSGSGFTRGVLNSISNSSFPNKILTFNTNLGNPVFSSSPSPNPLPLPGVFYPQHQHQHQQQFEQQSDQKPQLLVNHPTQNQAIFLPLPHNHQDLMQPQAKRHQPDPHELFLRGAQHQQQGHSLRQQHQQQGFPQQLQLMPNNLQQQQQLQKLVDFAGEEAAVMQQQQQALVDQLFKAAELLESGNLVHARGILARLNHHPQLSSPVGKPIVRSAFYFKEALQLIINNTNVNVVTTPPKRILTPFDVFLKIDTYKTFSELSPILQFVNFTCNQALLEALDNFHCIHIIDFDIGFGSQWASFMQEIASRVGGPPTLKITAVATPSSYDHPLELILTQENLAHFANDLGISFKFELLSLDSFESLSLHEGEAIAVYLPPGSSSYHPSSLPSLLRLVKQIAPKIVVSVDRGCDRSDLPFSHHFLHELQSYSVLFDSLDSINTNSDIVNKIERFLLQPRIESAVLRRHHFLDKLPPWRTLFASAGFSPYTFSNFCETQAECVVKRLQVRGFHVEKRQASLVLCWQRRELVSASAWSC